MAKMISLPGCGASLAARSNFSKIKTDTASVALPDRFFPFIFEWEKVSGEQPISSLFSDLQNLGMLLIDAGLNKGLLLF